MPPSTSPEAAVLFVAAGIALVLVVGIGLSAIASMGRWRVRPLWQVAGAVLLAQLLIWLMVFFIADQLDIRRTIRNLESGRFGSPGEIRQLGPVIVSYTAGRAPGAVQTFGPPSGTPMQTLGASHILGFAAGATGLGMLAGVPVLMIRRRRRHG